MRYTPLNHTEQEELLREGNYRPMIDIRDVARVGMEVQVLNSYGELRQYTITNPSDSDRLVVAMTKVGEHPEEEVCLDSSMSNCYDIGWRLLK